MNINCIEKNIGEGFKMAESSLISCKSLSIGRNVIIDERVKIKCKEDIVIGDNTFIGNDVTIALDSFYIGEYCKLHNHILVNGKNSVRIGSNCWFGQNTVLNGEALLTIGNNVGIGTYSSVWTHGYFGQLIDGCKIFSIKPTIIEDDVWLIGSYNTVFPGVTIGKRSVLMGTSVVTMSMESNRIYSGNPAKDITDKIGEPYETISFNEKVKILKEHIENFLISSKLDYRIIENNIVIHDYGIILFSQIKVTLDHETDSVLFQEKVSDWSIIEKCSKFCLTSKTYQKRYSRIEVLTRTILNPVAARFIPIN